VTDNEQNDCVTVNTSIQQRL